MKKDPSSVARPTPQPPPQNKMDHKLAAKGQDYEVEYITNKYDVPKTDVLLAIQEVGRSRKKIYDYLRKVGYSIGKK